MAAETEAEIPSTQRSPTIGVLLVVSTFLVYVPVAGFAQSFGVFVEMFDRDFCKPSSCLNLLGLVSALAISNFRLLCWVQVLLERWFSVATLFMAGTALCYLSMLLTSYVNSIHALLLTHSLLYGFGSTFMLNAPITAINHYYPESHRYHILASGIVNLGPAIGVVVMNPLSVYLDGTERYSWRDTLKIFAIAIFVVSCVHVIVLTRTYVCQPSHDVYEQLGESEPSNMGEDGTSKWRPSKWLNCASLTWLLGIFGVSSAIFIPKTMFINFLVSQGFPLQTSALLLSLSGVSETVFSLIISFTGDLLGRKLLLVYVLSATALAGFNGVLPFMSGQYAMGAYCLMHGACDGLLMTVLFGVTTLVAPPGGSRDVLWSLTNLVVGVGQIAGLPAAGLIFDVSHSYDPIFISAAAIFAISAGMFGVTFAYISLKYKTSDDKEALVESEQINYQSDESEGKAKD